MLLLLTALFIALGLTADTEGQAGQNAFNGAWQLDRKRGAETTDAMLREMGLSATHRNIILSLDVVERYEVSATTLRLKRETAYRNSDETFHLNVEEAVDDVILGPCRQAITLAQQRINTVIKRADGATLISVRKIQGGVPGQQFTNSMNFTSADGTKHVSTVRFYTKINTMRGLHERVGTLNVYPLRRQ